MSRKNIKEITPPIETFANIKVVGVGGSGNSAINRMVKSKIRGVEFIAINTDAQALHHSIAPTKVHIGRETTKGLGAGMDPDLGTKSAEENEQDIINGFIELPFPEFPEDEKLSEWIADLAQFESTIVGASTTGNINNAMVSRFYDFCNRLAELEPSASNDKVIYDYCKKYIKHLEDIINYSYKDCN